DFRHQLDAYARIAVGVLEVVYQLGKVLDRVDVVMRRRRDQAHPWRGQADARDPGIDLVAGELAAFAGLGALGHLDLQLAGHDQVFAGDAETAGRDLLDRAVLGIAAVVGPLIALGVFAALTGIALAADAIHGDRQRLVSFLADGAVGHGAGF